MVPNGQLISSGNLLVLRSATVFNVAQVAGWEPPQPLIDKTKVIVSVGKCCDRDMSGRFGDASYAMEELVAELGSAFACAQLGVTNSPRQDHADYIASWINVFFPI